jgi:hypothetical protein
MALVGSTVSADAVAKSAKMRAMNQFPISDVKAAFSDKSMASFIEVAALINVDTISSYQNTLQQVTPQDIGNSIILKMKENPKWDKNLPSQNVTKLKVNLDLIKSTFSEKTYAWAWFQKQFGETKSAKEILQNLFKDAYQSGVQMSHRGFGYSNPLTELGYIQSALEPLSTVEEKKDMAEKVQKVKTIYSNLPPSNIQT